MGELIFSMKIYVLVQERKYSRFHLRRLGFCFGFDFAALFDFV